MKKYGILSLFFRNYNFGGQLQAFALQREASKADNICEQIRYDNKFRYPIYCYLRGIKHAKINEIPKIAFELFAYIFKCIILASDTFAMMRRRKVFSDFSVSVPHSDKVFNLDNLKMLNCDYDGFIVGSDCVWSCYENSNVYTLSFVETDKRKISYAASLGCMHIPEKWADKFLDSVKSLDSVSVREKSIAEELQKLIPEKSISVVADPTLLMTAEEWDNCIPQTKTSEKYALIYILSEDKEQCLSAEKQAHKMGIKTLTFPHIHNRIKYWQKNYGDIRDFSSGPLEFVSLIKNAEIIITDSFHAVVFSTIFHRPFYALKRKSEKEFIGRVENFLDDIGLSSQLISSEELEKMKENPAIDFSYADKIIEQKREESIKYLKDNLV